MSISIHFVFARKFSRRLHLCRVVHFHCVETHGHLLVHELHQNLITLLLDHCCLLLLLLHIRR